MKRALPAARRLAGAAARSLALLAASAAASAAEAPAGGGVPQRTTAEMVLLLIGLGVFWLLAGGVLWTLVLRIREADRLHRLGGGSGGARGSGGADRPE